MVSLAITSSEQGVRLVAWRAARWFRVFQQNLDFCCRVHVRRTDKVGTEAAFHTIEEYMVHVEEHFQLLARRMQVDKKRVYLATDDPSLLKEAKTK